MVSGLSGTYEEKLISLNLPTLEARRTRGDLIQMYKTLTNKDKVTASTWFDIPNPRDGAASTRSVCSTYAVQRPNTLTMKEPRLHFWGTRCVDQWNNLPEHIKLSPSVNAFKENLDKLTNSHVNATTTIIPLQQQTSNTVQ